MQISKPYSQFSADYETEDISPTKHRIPSTHKINNPISQFVTTQAGTTYQTKKVSRTEQEIYSHDLISSIMNKRHHNTVHHRIGEFDPETQLYAKPINKDDNGMMQFSDQKHMYQSEYTKRINQINKKLNRNKSLSERLKQRKAETNLSFYNTKTKRPVSASQSKANQSTHKKISVSGLVSYNFNSVNARKTLGYDFERDDEKLSKILSKLQTRNKCYVSRQFSMMEKKNIYKAKKQKQIKQAIISDFQTKTGNFLQNLQQQVNQQETVYGMKWGKILCIKQLMQKQGVSYEEAQSIVNQIEQKQATKTKQPVKKLQRDEESELNNRKKIVQKGKIILKHLYFVD